MPHQPRLIDLTTNRSFPLAKDRILLGRALSSDIAIEDLNVSRTHAEIRQEAANAWSIADLGSTNGTLVNGRHIASVMLQEGDRVTVGTYHVPLYFPIIPDGRHRSPILVYMTFTVNDRFFT